MRELEKQAIKLHEGWENELVIGVDDTFPFSLLAPLIEAFYQHHSVTRLKFINGVLGGSWDALTQGRADIIVGAMHEPPSSSEFGFFTVGRSGTSLCGRASSSVSSGRRAVKPSYY
ncbi:LysR family transcriptional regulator [Escherichia coli]|uniref:LysR family transcriptional regulator n=1 Tax=Escherichia coli TaxID=562 RepID=A0A376KRQ7_ECOLX|nr:LysR family transcriptional regulator [Escherichia coli]